MVIHAIIIAVCLGVGFFFQYKTNDIDALGEQVAEAVLNAEGVAIDFSSEKKAEQKQKDDANAKIKDEQAK